MEVGGGDLCLLLGEDTSTSLAATAAAQPPSKVEPEGQAPLADALVGDGDAALGQQVVDVPKAEAESVTQPHGVGNDLGREPITVVAGLRSRGSSLPGAPLT